MKMNGSCEAGCVDSTSGWRKAMVWLGLVFPVKSAAASLHFTMNQGAFRQFAGQRFAEVECISGTVWVTESGREDDLMLKAGERCRLLGSGQVLVQALTPAQIFLHA